MSTKAALPFSGVLVATMLVTGCLPVVAHGPQVENALSGGLTAGWSVGPNYPQGDWGEWPVMVPSIGLNVSRGWRGAQPGDGAFQLSAHVPAIVITAPLAALMLTQADGYYQFPATFTRDLDAGAGINFSLLHAMPYAQLGNISEEGTGWYTTQGFGFLGEEMGQANLRLRALAWIPTLAWQSTKGNRTIHYFATGAVARELDQCYYEGCDPPEYARFMIAVGVTLQFHRRR